MLLDIWLGSPLALRMAEQAAAAASETAVPCSAGSEHAMSGHGEPDRPAAPGHQHQTCPLCQGGLGPLLLLAAWSLPLPAAIEAPPDAPRPDRVPVRSAAAAYAPRAPPING